MNTTATPDTSPLGDDDIRAFGARPATAAAAAPAARRRRWPWVLLALTLLGLVSTLWLGSLVWHEFDGMAGHGDWQLGIGPEGWHGDVGAGGVLAAALGMGLVLLLVAVVLPLVLLLAGLAVALSVLLSVGVVVGTLGLTLAGGLLLLLLLTSPLWLLGLLLWWALKPAAVASAASI
jgi:hypothetical protein